MPGDTIKIKLPSLKGVKKNPWILATILIGTVAIIASAILVAGYIQSNPPSSCSLSADSNSGAQQVGQNIVSLLNSNKSSTAQLYNVTEFSGIYQINVIYQNQTIPVYSTTDGKYLIQAIIPLQ